MANGPKLKEIALKRLEAAKILAAASDSDGAGQMLGLSLECALKSACCKALRLSEYPAGRDRKKDGDTHFESHNFDRLLTISGCEDLFVLGGEGWISWSEFTSPFAECGGEKGKWFSMRYDVGIFSEQQIIDLAKALEGSEAGKEGIFTLLTRHERW